MQDFHPIKMWRRERSSNAKRVIFFPSYSWMCIPCYKMWCCRSSYFILLVIPTTTFYTKVQTQQSDNVFHNNSTRVTWIPCLPDVPLFSIFALPSHVVNCYRMYVFCKLSCCKQTHKLAVLHVKKNNKTCSSSCSSW